MTPVCRSHGTLSSLVAFGDGLDEIFVGVDLAGQAMTQHLDHIAAGQQLRRLPVGQSLLGQEHQRDHHQGHVVMPTVPEAHLIVGHATLALGVLKGPFDEVTGRLHHRQMAQRGVRFGVGQTELEFRSIQLAAHQKMPLTCLGGLLVPDKHTGLHTRP